MIAALWARFSGYFAAAGALIIAGFSIWLKGREHGKDVMREEQERHRREAIAAKRKLDSEIDRLPAADLDRRAGRWVREEHR